jgi:hypothetical protein
MFRRFVAAVLALTLPFAAFAQTGAVVESLRGVAQAGNAELKQGQRLTGPTTLSTQAGAQASLRFDDGMQIVLGENTLLRIIDFRHAAGSHRAAFELLLGSARVVTGRVAANDPSQFLFRTPQADLRAEDASVDFSVALVNPAYVMVQAGRVLAVNGQGTTVLNAGRTWFIASASSVPAVISTHFIPPAASSSLNNLSAATLSSPQGGSMAGFEGGGGPAREMHQWLLLGLIAAAVIVVVAAQDGDSQTTPQH